MHRSAAYEEEVSDESKRNSEYLSPNSHEMALATAGHLDYPSAIRHEATAGIGDVAAKWPVFVPCSALRRVFCHVSKSRSLVTVCLVK